MNTRKKKTRKTPPKTPRRAPVIPTRKVKPETVLRAELERAELARDATRLKKAGLTYRQIAERLACSPGMAHALVHEGIDAYVAEAKTDAGELVETIIAGLLQASQELWIQWERLTRNRERISTKTIPGKRKPQVTETVEGRCGDPRFMDSFRENMETIARLRGVLKGERAVEVNVKNEQTAVVQQRTPAELIAEYAAQIQAAYEPPPETRKED